MHATPAAPTNIISPETDDHEYKSLIFAPEDKNEKPPEKHFCKNEGEVLHIHKKETHAMLNHPGGGTVHFAIKDKVQRRRGLTFPRQMSLISCK